MFDITGLGHVFGRVIFLFIAALIVVRIMGNRTVGQLSPFDFVIMVGIGDIIITAAMDPSQSLFNGVEGLVALLVLQQVLSYLSLKNVTLRKWFEGVPVTLIENGHLIRANFIKTQFNYDDLRQELHRQGLEMEDVPRIKLARLESCGVFSIIKKPEYEPVNRQDFEQYLQEGERNPLSSVGEKWTKLERFMEDTAYIADSLREQTSKPLTAESSNPEKMH